MRHLWVLCLLLGPWAYAQEEPAPEVPPQYRPPIVRDQEEEREPPTMSSVAPDAPVLTIDGLCSQAQTRTPETKSPSSPCRTVITRAQFEKLTDAIQPNMTPSLKRQLASSYPQLLAMAREAEARGLENDPRFQERIAFAKVQILSRELIQQIEDESAKVPEKDIEDYYRAHADDFQQATLDRIFVPNEKRLDPLPKGQSTPEAINAQRKEAIDAMNREAEQLRAQAAAGEDFMKLQKEAYAAAGLTDVPPTTSLGWVKLSSLPVGHRSVFALKSGEVSQVISDSTGHYIYKLETKELQPLDAARKGILRTIENQRTQQALNAIQQRITTDVNTAYFGAPEDSGDAAPAKSR